MKQLRLILATLAAVASILVISGCGKSSDPTSPSSSLDTTPPPAPSGLSIRSLPDQNTLSWEPSAAADVAGYQVYQYEPDPTRDNSYVMVAETTSPSLDMNNHANVDAYFRVRAVDAAGNHSALSSELEAHVPGLLSGGGGPSNPGDGRQRIDE